MPRHGARSVLRDWLLHQPPGTVFTVRELTELTGVLNTDRRLRELRELEGFNILSYRDLPELRPSEYKLGDPVLLTPNPVTVNKRESALHLAYHPYCDGCRRMAGDRSGRDPAKRAELTVCRNAGGDLVVLCDACLTTAGPESMQPYTPTTLVDRILTAPTPVKHKLLHWLSLRIFEEDSHG